MVNTRLFILSTDTPFSRAKFYVDLDDLHDFDDFNDIDNVFFRGAGSTNP